MYVEMNAGDAGNAGDTGEGTKATDILKKYCHRIQNIIHDGVASIEFLDEHNIADTCVFMGDAFIDEPIGYVIGLSNKEDNNMMHTHIYHIFNDEKRANMQNSIILRIDNIIVGAIIICMPMTQLPVVSQRLEKCFQHVDTMAIYENNTNITEYPEYPELLYGAVKKEYRGKRPNADKTIYQYMCECIENILHGRGFDGMKSHSNDYSMIQHKRDNWDIIVSIPFYKLPDDIIYNAKDGHISLCIKTFH